MTPLMGFARPLLTDSGSSDCNRTNSTGPASITALFGDGCAHPQGRLTTIPLRRKEYVPPGVRPGVGHGHRTPPSPFGPLCPPGDDRCCRIVPQSAAVHA